VIGSDCFTWGFFLPLDLRVSRGLDLSEKDRQPGFDRSMKES